MQCRSDGDDFFYIYKKVFTFILKDFFSFSYLKMLLHSLLFIFSVEKYAIIVHSFLHNVSFSPSSCFKDFSLYTGFDQFDYDVPWCSFLHENVLHLYSEIQLKLNYLETV